MSKYLLGTAALALAAAAAALPGTASAQGAAPCSGPPANGIHFSYVLDGRQSARTTPVCSAVMWPQSQQVTQGADPANLPRSGS
jgi:hypothetical protein